MRRSPCTFSSLKKGIPTRRHAGFLVSISIRAAVGLHGRHGVEGLAQQGLDPRPRKAVREAGRSGRFLSEDERVFIADPLLGRASIRSIARDLGRSPSTIIREFARNRPDSRRYHPFRAGKMVQKRRPRPGLAKLVDDVELRHYVVECLSKRWSPQQVCRASKQTCDEAGQIRTRGGCPVRGDRSAVRLSQAPAVLSIHLLAAFLAAMRIDLIQGSSRCRDGLGRLV